MGARTSGREAALQILYAVETTGAEPERAIHDFWRELPGDAEGRPYADELVRGVRADLAATDARIRAASTNWRIERMTRIDRNVLRLGAWELATQQGVPRAVIIDEAVEIAKRYGTQESSAFVNGVLDRIADDCGRSDGDDEDGADGDTEGGAERGAAGSADGHAEGGADGDAGAASEARPD